EKHFAGTNRLSPYMGAELGIGIRSSKAETTVTEDNTTGSIAISGATGVDANDNAINPGYFGLGLNGVIGCDFYFSRKIYVGMEAFFGLNFTSYSQPSVTYSEGSTSITTKLGKAGAFNLAPGAQGTIRIGFAF